jgi:hypothetical protein
VEALTCVDQGNKISQFRIVAFCNYLDSQRVHDISHNAGEIAARWFAFGLPDGSDAEGATAPETLRHQNRN